MRVFVRVVLVVMMQYDQAVDDQVEGEAERNDGSDEGRRVVLPDQLNSLRHQLEECHTDDCSRAKSKDEMQPILEVQRQPTAEKRGAGCRDADEDNHVR